MQTCAEFDERTTPVGRWFESIQAIPPFRADLTMALALMVAGLLQLLFGDGERSPVTLGFALLANCGTTLPLAWRRRHPDRVMTAVGLSGALSVLPLADLTFFGAFGIMVALYSVVAHGPWRDAVGSGVATTIVLTVIGIQHLSMGIAGVVSNYVLFGTAWVVGYAMRTRRRLTEELTARAEAAERAREVEAQNAVNAERSRIARELHDVIAHTVSVMVVQAGAARRITERDPVEAREAMTRIEETGRNALTELRRMLSLLRDGDGDGVPMATAPQPGLAALQGLVETMEQAGIPVSLAVVGSIEVLPAGVDLTAYRIVQEALTNVLKHAGPVRRVDVVVRQRASAVAVAVRDDGIGAAARTARGPAGDGSGRGLVGLQERVALLGGEFVARPRRGGGFEVVATLPLTASDRSDLRADLQPVVGAGEPV